MEKFPDPELDLSLATPMVNKVKHELVCPVHHKRVRLALEYDNHGANAHIVFYCCRYHADTVAKALYEIELINNVIIKQL